MSNNVINSVVIVGSGVEAWLTAALMSQAYQDAGVEVTLVEDKPTADQVHKIHPDNLSLLSQIGSNEKKLLSECGACFTVGSRFEEWGGNSYFQPLGGHGGPMDYVSFQHFAIKRSKQTPTSYDSYSLATAVALANKFAHPQAAPNSILSTLVYGLSIGAKDWEKELKSKPFTMINASIESALLSDDKEKINSLVLSNGKTIHADLFMDCTGARRELISLLSGYQCDSLSGASKVNRTAQLTKDSSQSLNHGIVKADAYGWLRQDFTQTKVTNTYHYNSDSLSDDEVQLKLNQSQEQDDDVVWTFSSFEPSVVKTPWLGNCVAIGSTQACLDAIDSDPLHGLIVNLDRFMNLFPRSENWKSQIFEFNRKTGWWYNNLQEMIISRYMGLEETHPLAISKDAETTESLNRKLQLFSNNGQLAYYEEEPFHEPYRVALLLGMGFTPIKYDPLLDNFNFVLLEERFERMKLLIDQMVQQLPTHDNYIKQLASA